MNTDSPNIAPLPSPQFAQPMQDEAKKSKSKVLLYIIIAFLIIVIVAGIGYVVTNSKKPVTSNTISNKLETNTVDNTLSDEPVSTAINFIQPGNDAPDNKKFSIIVPASSLQRTAGGDTEFVLMGPTDSELIKNTIENHVENAELNYTLKGKNFEINIAQPNEVFPLKFDATLTPVGLTSKIGPFWRYTTQSGSYNYTSQVETEKTCTLVDGTTAEPTCGQPGLAFTDEDLKSFIILSCTGDANICDAVVKTLDMHKV